MLITDEYKKLNSELHETRKDYGVSSGKWVDTVAKMMYGLNTQSVLDYGCGKAELQKGLPINIQNYDPCIEKYSQRPKPSDLVVCTDVLEHIEPECLDEVLDDIHSLCKEMVFLTVATREAKKTLADGRNAHLIVQDYKWWLPKLWQRFNMINFQNTQGLEFLFVGDPC